MSNDARILTYDELAKVEVRECGEQLIAIQDLPSPSAIVCLYEKEDMKPYLGDRMMVRLSVAHRLIGAARDLESRLPGAKIWLAYAYRHPVVQLRYFTRLMHDERLKNQNASELDLKRRVHNFVAAPEVAGHPTGGAVDLSIILNGKKLDMGSGIADFSSPLKLPTFSEHISTMQSKNRILLREIMLDQGFAPFNGEWWHFSYGDREWAAFYSQAAAVYGPITL